MSDRLQMTLTDCLGTVIARGTIPTDWLMATTDGQHTATVRCDRPNNNLFDYVMAEVKPIPATDNTEDTETITVLADFRIEFTTTNPLGTLAAVAALKTLIQRIDPEITVHLASFHERK